MAVVIIVSDSPRSHCRGSISMGIKHCLCMNAVLIWWQDSIRFTLKVPGIWPLCFSVDETCRTQSPHTRVYKTSQGTVLYLTHADSMNKHLYFLECQLKNKKRTDRRNKEKNNFNPRNGVCVCVFPFRKYPVLRKYPCCLSVTKWVPTMCQLWHIERHCGTIQIYMYMYMHIHIHHIHIRYNGLHL